MAARIIVEPGDVWAYLEENKEALTTSVEMIADNQEYGVEVYLTINYDGFAVITVMADDNQVYEEPVLNETDCTETAKKVYDEYLSSTMLQVLSGDEDYTMSEQLELIDDREEELDEAIYSLLETMAPNLINITDDMDEICEDLKEYVCVFLYKKYGISIYRPIFLEDEYGNDEFFEFPYQELD